METLLNPPQSLNPGASALVQLSSRLLGLPFDMARHHYAAGVRLGLIERSLLEWAKFERSVSALERLMLGPWARHV